MSHTSKKSDKEPKVKMLSRGPCNPICSILTNAGIPNELRWRSIFNFLRTLDRDDSYNEEQKRQFHGLLQELIQQHDFSDQNYKKTVEKIEVIRHLRCLSKEQELINKAKECEKSYDNLKSVLGNVLRAYANVASLGTQLTHGKVEDIEKLKEFTVTALENDEDREKIIQGVVNSTNSMVQKMNNEVALWKQKAQETESWKQKALEMEKLATIDSLTSLFNRRAFDHHIEEMVKAMIGRETYLSLMIIDIDHFKRFNDNYGHDIGDEVLKMVASIIRKNAYREGDFAARYGGEELILVCEGMDIEQTRELAENIRKDIERYSFIIREPEQKEAQVTVSIGVSELDCCKTNNVGGVDDVSSIVQQFIQSADKALYSAKKSGRNKVCIYES